jgi:hypothetical protein
MLLFYIISDRQANIGFPTPLTKSNPDDSCADVGVRGQLVCEWGTKEILQNIMII